MNDGEVLEYMASQLWRLLQSPTGQSRACNRGLQASTRPSVDVLITFYNTNF